jgi:hypothetical protein
MACVPRKNSEALLLGRKKQMDVAISIFDNPVKAMNYEAF